MRIIFTVFKKELLDTLRDKKTLFSAIILPAIAIPLLLFGVTKMQSSMTEKEMTRELKIVMIDAPEEMIQTFSDPQIRIIQDINLATAKDSVSAKQFDAILEFNKDFAMQTDSFSTGNIKMYYKSTEAYVKDRVMAKLDLYEGQLLQGRMSTLNITEEFLNPVEVTDVDLASQQEQIGYIIGGIIPYLFIIFCFTGCMYPSLDIVTGEKERGTIETLLTSPASRLHILAGKVMAISTIGVSAAVFMMGGMFFAFKYMSDIPAEILEAVSQILNAKFLLMLFAMLIPLSVFFAGLLSAIAIRANSFKEAQSYVTPMMFVVIVPAMLAMIPGVELNWQNIWIPVMNVSLALKDIIAGTIDPVQYMAIVLSLVILAVLAVLGSLRQFSKEGMVLK